MMMMLDFYLVLSQYIAYMSLAFWALFLALKTLRSYRDSSLPLLVKIKKLKGEIMFERILSLQGIINALNKKRDVCLSRSESPSEIISALYLDVLMHTLGEFERLVETLIIERDNALSNVAELEKHFTKEQNRTLELRKSLINAQISLGKKDSLIDSLRITILDSTNSDATLATLRDIFDIPQPSPVATETTPEAEEIAENPAPANAEEIAEDQGAIGEDPTITEIAIEETQVADEALETAIKKSRPADEPEY